ncbi:MAG: hypothetical protein VYE73_08370, partial [Acidobacteriota bacterium]|nr:hypothetical protein [Acidobacteriota bacterium]
WQIDALREVTSGNTPPRIAFVPGEKTGQGPAGTRGHAETSVSRPLTLTLRASDDGVRKRRSANRPPTLGLVWSKYRGPGSVQFSDATPQIADGKSQATATFDQPGSYTLRVLAWDDSGPQTTTMAVGFQCCWTNGYVDVTVSE